MIKLGSILKDKDDLDNLSVEKLNILYTQMLNDIGITKPQDKMTLWKRDFKTKKELLRSWLKSQTKSSDPNQLPLYSVLHPIHHSRMKPLEDHHCKDGVNNNVKNTFQVNAHKNNSYVSDFKNSTTPSTSKNPSQHAHKFSFQSLGNLLIKRSTSGETKSKTFLSDEDFFGHSLPLNESEKVKIEKQLKVVMDSLKISNNARPEFQSLPHDKKILLIHQMKKPQNIDAFNSMAENISIDSTYKSSIIQQLIMENKMQEVLDLYFRSKESAVAYIHDMVTKSKMKLKKTQSKRSSLTNSEMLMGQLCNPHTPFKIIHRHLMTLESHIADASTEWIHNFLAIQIKHMSQVSFDIGKCLCFVFWRAKESQKFSTQYTYLYRDKFPVDLVRIQVIKCLKALIDYEESFQTLSSQTELIYAIADCCLSTSTPSLTTFPTILSTNPNQNYQDSLPNYSMKKSHETQTSNLRQQQGLVLELRSIAAEILSFFLYKFKDQIADPLCKFLIDIDPLSKTDSSRICSLVQTFKKPFYVGSEAELKQVMAAIHEFELSEMRLNMLIFVNQLLFHATRPMPILSILKKVCFHEILERYDTDNTTEDYTDQLLVYRNLEMGIRCHPHGLPNHSQVPYDIDDLLISVRSQLEKSPQNHSEEPLNKILGHFLSVLEAYKSNSNGPFLNSVVNQLDRTTIPQKSNLGQAAHFPTPTQPPMPIKTSVLTNQNSNINGYAFKNNSYLPSNRNVTSPTTSKNNWNPLMMRNKKSFSHLEVTTPTSPMSYSSTFTAGGVGSLWQENQMLRQQIQGLYDFIKAETGREYISRDIKELYNQNQHLNTELSKMKRIEKRKGMAVIQVDFTHDFQDDDTLDMGSPPPVPPKESISTAITSTIPPPPPAPPAPPLPGTQASFFHHIPPPMGGLLPTTQKPRPIDIPKSSKPLKPIEWTKLANSQVENTVWSSIFSEAYSQIEEDNTFLNENLLEQLFLKEHPKSLKKSFGPPKSEEDNENKSRPAPSSTTVSVLKPNRARNIGIMLKGLRLEPSQIKEALLKGDMSTLYETRLQSLLCQIPTEEEYALVQSYPDSQTLAEADLFVKEIFSVDHYQSRLETLLFMIRLPSELEDMQDDLQKLLLACQELQDSAKVKNILKRILVLGNFMNGTSFRGDAQGFKLDVLLKLKNTRSRNPLGRTILHYLVRHLDIHQITLMEETQSVAACARMSVSTLLQSIDQTNAETKKIGRFIETMEKQSSSVVKETRKEDVESEITRGDVKKSPDSTTFLEKLKMFHQRILEDVEKLNEDGKTAEKKIKELYQYFGEEIDERKDNLEELFIIFHTFSISLMRAHQENEAADILAMNAKHKDIETESSKNKDSLTIPSPKEDVFSETSNLRDDDDNDIHISQVGESESQKEIMKTPRRAKSHDLKLHGFRNVPSIDVPFCKIKNSPGSKSFNETGRSTTPSHQNHHILDDSMIFLRAKTGFKRSSTFSWKIESVMN